MTSELIARMPTAAFAFRGYNVTNLGKTPELLEHPVYGPTFEKHLKAASEIFTTATLRRVDLIKRVRLREETTLDSYGEALCLIGGASLAQLECLQEHFGVAFANAKVAIGYSLGEVVALSAADVYRLDALLSACTTVGIRPDDRACSMLRARPSSRVLTSVRPDTTSCSTCSTRP